MAEIFKLGNKKIIDIQEQINNINAIVHETVAQTVEEDYCFNSMTTPANVTIEETAYPVIDGTLSQIKALSGRSLKSENILNIVDKPETITNGITYKVENGVITLNGTAEAQFDLSLSSSVTLLGTFSINIFNTNSSIRIRPVNGNVDYIYNGSGTVTFSTNGSLLIRIFSGVTLNNAIIKPMLVVGSTVPTTFYPYWEGIKNAQTTAIKTLNSNGDTLTTLSIPSEIQALNGYGWGLSTTDKSLNNYIYFENKKFVKNVGRVDLSTLTWSYSGSYWFSDNFTTAKGGENDSDIFNVVLSPNYETVSIDTIYLGNQGIAIRNTKSIWVGTGSSTTQPNGIMYYQFATPVETDISQYITEDLIKINQSGAIELVNENNIACLSTLQLEVKYWRNN